ncbi:MAG: competence/damage-inducible protein A [Natronomonas sp.]
MDAALLTVGDELLDGDTENTNATWLAGELTDRGVDVRRILVVPDEVAVIADIVADYAETYDAVVVTGGLGGTPDDVTLDGVSAAFDRPMVVHEEARVAVEETLEAYLEERPDLDIDVDIDAEAALPEGGRPIDNPAGLSPGCVIENVYVLPGIPGEMKATFGTIAEAFHGDIVSRFRYTTEPEANMVGTLTAVRDRFDVMVGCYPDRDAGHNRLKISATEQTALENAIAYLSERIDVVTDPAELEA